MQSQWVRLAWAAFGLAVFGVACTPERTRAIAKPRPQADAGASTNESAALSRVTVTKSTDAIVVDLANALDRFRTFRGRMPKDLNELVSAGILRRLPSKPPGYDYRYDAATGNVTFVPVDDSGQIRIPDDTYEAPTLIKR